MNEDNLLQSVRKLWLKKDGLSSDFLHYLIDHQEVPGVIPDDPYISECTKNRITLSWAKPVHCGSAPILAYRIENWEIGADGGAKWTELGTSPTTSYDVYNLKPNKKYNFRIKARNQYGWGEAKVTSTPITIEETTEFPEFEKYLPGGLKALWGSSVELECKIRHEKGVQVQWYQDGVLLEENETTALKYENGRCLLKIKYVKDVHSGRYVCEAINAKGKVCTFTRLMVVTDPKIVNASSRLNRLRHENEGKLDMAPQFTMRLRNKRVQITYPVRLTCQVIGYPKPVVSWFKDEQNLKENDYYSMYSEADDFHSLEINHAMLEHSGTYSVTATNSSGNVSCKCDLVVDKGLRTYVPPTFTEKLNKVYSIAADSQLRIRALVQAYPAVGVTWQKNGIRLRSSRRIIVTLSHEGEIELTIAQIKEQDSGIYTCTAINEVGKAETNTRIEVYPKCNLTSDTTYAELSDIPYSKEPKFLIKPRSCEVVEGDRVIIECKIIGDPKPDILWLRDRLKLDYYRDSDEFKFSSEESAPFVYKLEIPRVKFDHIGAYTIIAKNEYGEAKAVVSLQVYSKDTKKNIKMKDEKTKYSQVEKIPKIKRHLSDIKCCDGDSVTFELEVDTEGDSSELDFHWYKNGKLIPLDKNFVSDVNGNVASFTVHQVYPEDEGQYSCSVSNNLGTAKSTACLIVDVPEEKENIIHRPLNPSCVKSKITNHISNCTVNFSKENVIAEKSNPHHRIKHSAPKFYAIPHNKIAEEGDTVRFQCAVTGHPTPSTSWDKNSIPINSTARISVQEQNDLRILEISNVTLQDEGLYRIVIENELGQSEATARLDIINSRRRQRNDVEARTYEKHFGRHIVGKVANVNGKCSISCNVSDTSGNGSATWYKNGETLQKSENIIQKYSETAYQLHFNKLTLEDSGVYTCILENNFGKTRCAAELIVLDNHNFNNMDLQPPVFVVGIPQETCIIEGQSFQFRVKLHGALPIHVTWLKNEEKIPDCSDFQYINHGHGEFSLKLNDAFIPDTGLYKCEAYNCHGDAVCAGHLVITEFSSEKMLSYESLDKIPDSRNEDGLSSYEVNDEEIVLNPATVIRGPTDKTVLRGETVSLIVYYFGNPAPAVKWMKAGRQLIPDNRISILTNDGESILKLNQVTADDGGKYEIIVENELGVDTHTTSLAVGGSSDAPNSRPNAVAGDRSATVTWCSPPYDGGSKITGYTVEMRSYSNSQWRKVVENCHSLFCTVRGLTPGESYIFRIRAENIYGLSNPSMESVPIYITHADVCCPVEQKQVHIQNDELQNHYELLAELGRGRYGIVHKVRDKEFGNFYTAKFIRCFRLKDKEKARKEVEFMNILKHPKLLQLIAAFENSRDIVMVTEYISGGELFARVADDDFTLTERDCILFMRQICEGVAFIHKNNIVHLDLKPENIMCVSRTSHLIKLIDFGLAQKISTDTPVRALYGTPEFVAPEIINYDPIGTESDMWSVGVICYILLSGLSPFLGDNDAETFANVTRADYDFDEEAFKAISKDAKDFISSLLIKKKEKRLTAKQCLYHKWLAQHDKTMSCVKLCTDELKKFNSRRWQKHGNAMRALIRMITLRLMAQNSRSSSGNSSSSNSPRVSVSTTCSSRISSLVEDNPLVVNSSSPENGDQNPSSTEDIANTMERKTSIDEIQERLECDHVERIKPKSSSKNSQKMVAFKEICNSEIIPRVRNSAVNEQSTDSLSSPLSESNKIISNCNQNSCSNVEKDNVNLNSECTTSKLLSSVISKINRDTDLNRNSKFEAFNKVTNPSKLNSNSHVRNVNDKQDISSVKNSSKCENIRYANGGKNKLSSPFVDQQIIKCKSNSNKSCEKLSSCADNVNKNSANSFLSTKEINLDKGTNHKSSHTAAKINTAEWVKKFEKSVSENSSKPKIKKEPLISNKEEFQKTIAFWKRE